jgi:hypothetical protein
MEMTIQVPFQKLLALVKTLSPSQKAILRKELHQDNSSSNNKDEFIEFLTNGPVYSENDIAKIEENRKSIAAWRTSN